MRKFTESKSVELKGWSLLMNNMRKVSFEIENGEFFAYLDGDIWDYSEEPIEFCEVINNTVYTKVDIGNKSVEYKDPIGLNEWIELNLK